MTTILRRLRVVGTPVTLGVALWWHPAGGDDVYDGVRGDVGAWLFVHTALLLPRALDRSPLADLARAEPAGTPG